MDHVTDPAPPGWIEALDEADAEIDAGLFVSADEVQRFFRDAKARRQPTAEGPTRHATTRQ
jgi:hypothetical protein